MPVERPTFHESWYRVASLHPRLRSTVQVSRQHFRGLPWHVVQDHTNNAFFRLAEPAYRYIGLLDGKRTVGQAWEMANEHLGDDAPTQGEVIQLLGQLYTANLLQAEVPADTHMLFGRYRKRKQREIAGYMMNIMFARLPIFDPDAFLNRWLPVLGWIFSPVGFVIWMILIGLGIHSISQVPNWSDKIMDGAGGVLSPDNLALLYVGFAMIKACHEMGHAISCKKFGRQSGSGGEVHVIGIMFLIFTPVPYVDASSSWALTNKWHRAIVGAAGMWVELAIASIAAMAWASTADTHWVHAFAYNIMFVASFSTVVFNANPLLRYDGYYILSDLLEIPNLAQRSKEYVYYIVKRYIWNVRHARNPAHGPSERIWLFIYAVASFVMRTVVTFGIMFYLTRVLNGTLIILAAGMAIAGVVTWLFVPIGKFFHYLATSGELSRVRGRAVISSVAVIGAIVAAIGFIKVPDRARAQGVVEPQQMVELYPREDGFVSAVAIDQVTMKGMPGGEVLRTLSMPVTHEGDMLLRETNPALDLERDSLVAQLKGLQVRERLAVTEDAGKAQQVRTQIVGIQQQIAAIDQRLADLELASPLTGVLVTPDLETRRYGYVKRTDRLGLVADLHHLIVRAATGNDLAGPLTEEASRQVEIRIAGRPEILMVGQISSILPAGSTQLPSASLGYQVGGQFHTASDDRHGTKTDENFFEVRIDRLSMISGPEDVMKKFAGTGDVPLLPGQRVVVRFEMKPKPIAVQFYKLLRQVFQKNYQM